MKKLATIILSALTLAAPLAISTPASAHERHGGYERGHDDGYRDGRRGDHRRHDRWDDRRYNGYSYRGNWYWGPAPSHYRDVDYGYRAWRRGDRLPGYYRDRYVVVDYHRYGYRAPPRGYHYVRDDRGEVLLVGIATGVILGTILGGY